VAEQKQRKLKAIEICPEGHHYNSSKYGDTCWCGKKLDPPEPEELTPEELTELSYLDEKSWVCGWLVCIKGPNKGRGYEIRDGKNFIGSASSMDIQIIGDRRIEKKNHAVVLYDSKARKTFLIPGDSHGLVYLQDEIIFEPKQMEAFNKIELGESLFRYAPLCGGEFDWKDIVEK